MEKLFCKHCQLLCARGAPIAYLLLLVPCFGAGLLSKGLSCFESKMGKKSATWAKNLVGLS